MRRIAHPSIEKAAEETDIGTQTPAFDVTIKMPYPSGMPPKTKPPHLAKLAYATHQNEQKTILLVTDDKVVLDFVAESLVSNNYNVLVAKNSTEALKRMEDYKSEIHLLLSALDMEGVNGLGLAAVVSAKWPNLKVLLMSECRGGTLVLNEGWHFLPKPFVTSQLNALILTLISPPGMIPKYKRSTLSVALRG
jgi:CheY-like chemotaxis protein